MNSKRIVSEGIYNTIILTFILCSFGTIIICDSAPTGQDACAEMKSCVSPYPMLVDLVENDLAKGLAVLTYDVLLNDTCGRLPEFNLCLQNSRSCGVFKVYQTAGAVRRVLDYLCTQGRNAYLSETDCFFRDEFQNGLTQCTDMMSIEVDSVQMMIQGGLADSKKFCRVLDKLLKCLKKRVTMACTARAAEFTYGVYQRIIENILTSLACTGY